MASTTSDLRKALEFLGYNSTTGKPDIKVTMFLTSLISLMINTIYFMYETGDNVDNRIHGMQTLMFYLLLGFPPMVFLFNWDNFILLIKVVEESHYEFPYQVSAKRQRIMNSTKTSMNKLNSLWVSAIKVCVVTGLLVPIFSLIKAVLVQNIKAVQVEDLTLIIPIYYPKDHKTLQAFFLGYTLQTIFYAGGALYGYIGLAGSLISMLLLEGELKLLRLTIKEMDEKLFPNEEVPERQIKSYEHPVNKEMIVLKSFLRYFIWHHQSIYRKVQDINKGLTANAFIKNFGVSIYVCMGIYIIVERDGLILKLQQMSFCFLWSFDIFCYDFMGERIATENEKLLRALYQCSWYDKPQWFKKSLHIIMTRSDKRVEMKPAGLFVLNLKNYAKFVNAAYSYYHVLNSFK